MCMNARRECLLPSARAPLLVHPQGPRGWDLQQQPQQQKLEEEEEEEECLHPRQFPTCLRALVQTAT